MTPPSKVAEIASGMPCITLWQPWASLIFVEQVDLRKLHETRSFRPPLKYVGGRIAIHAAAAFPPLKVISEELHELCYDAFGCGYHYSLPRGVMLGTAILSGAVPATERTNQTTEEDRIAGDWSPGRWAWPLSDIEPLANPIPAKGKQGWWQARLQSQSQGQPE